MADPSTIRDILALAPNWLGDVAMCTPALRTLSRGFPEARLAVAGCGAACDLLEGLPFIDALHRLPDRPGAWGTWRESRKLRGYARDLTVVFPHSFRSALLARMCGSRRVLGYDRGQRSFLLTDKVAPAAEDGKMTPVYMVWEYLDLLVPLGCEYDGFGLDLVADERDVAGVREHLVGDGPWIGFAPGAAFGPSKRWPAERFAAVADALHDRLGARCVLMTGPGEEDTRDAILDAARHPLVECDERQPTVGKLKATISCMDLLVCNDSGPRHVAVAFGVPAICIMGSTAPAYSSGPYETGQVLRVDVDCGPCQKPVCTTDHRCMTGVEVGAVVDAVIAALPGSRVRG